MTSTISASTPASIGRLIATGTLLGAAACAFAGAPGAGGPPAQPGGGCMDVVIEPFHMVPGFMTEAGACAVRDFLDGELQEAFYPFTVEDHRFNCEVFGDAMPLKIGGEQVEVPTSVQSDGPISGTIGGAPFTADLYCASLTNWYEQFCADPADPTTCLQLAQPFLSQGLPYPRVTEVSVFDGVVTVGRGKKTVEVPLLLVTRAAGITHLEDLTTNPPLVGASVTHSLLGMVTLKGDDDLESLDGSADLLLQGHIFAPIPVADDPGAARIRGALCGKDVQRLLRGPGGKRTAGGPDDDDTDDDDDDDD